ncbi:hypothetical protein MSG28_009132, partial [Choristoneura fumiferana]
SELPKEFEKTSEVLPFTKYGISTLEEFKTAEETVQNLEWFKKVGLTNEEVKLYQDDVAGRLDLHRHIESSVSNQCETEPSTSKSDKPQALQTVQKNNVKFYPDGHPMNELKELEDNMFGHLKDKKLPITKRRKILRRLVRRKERILSKSIDIGGVPVNKEAKPGSLWDVRDATKRAKIPRSRIGPKDRTMYTIRNNKIVRLKPVRREQQVQNQQYEAVDIVMPVNAAEEQLLEGTKMCIDDIKKIERFKDYEPGVPSKVLYLKNIAPAVSQDQLSLLFNQFILDNGGPVDIRLMNGRMRGQAFVAFQNEDVAIQAVHEINGTILSGRPVIAQFGRNSNRIEQIIV